MNYEAFCLTGFLGLFRCTSNPGTGAARKNYELLKKNPGHPSLHFKKVGRYRSVRVGRQYRALGVEIPEGVLWFWIGSHAEYDRLLS